MLALEHHKGSSICCFGRPSSTQSTNATESTGPSDKPNSCPPQYGHLQALSHYMIWHCLPELLELVEKAEKEQVSRQPAAPAIPATPITPAWVIFTCKLRAIQAPSFIAGNLNGQSPRPNSTLSAHPLANGFPMSSSSILPQDPGLDFHSSYIC